MAARRTVIYLSCIHVLITVFAIYVASVEIRYHELFMEGAARPDVSGFFSAGGWIMLFLPLGLLFISRTKIFRELTLRAQTFALIGAMIPVFMLTALAGLRSLAALFRIIVIN